MPSNFLTADTSFPDLSGNQSTNEKFEQLSSYLFMLLEQLRYSFANLGQENFNDTAFQDIATIIRKPVYIQLENTDKQVASFAVAAEGLSSRLEDAEGNISQLSQMANGLSTRVEDAEGNISQLSQTVNGLSLTVDNGSSTSTIALVSNGVEISSQKISFSGMVVFNDLSGSGRSKINGDNITTGTISAITISACDVNSSVFRTNLAANGTIGGEIEMCYTGNQYVAGGIRLDDRGAGTEIESKYRMFIYTNSVKGVPFALKFESAGGMSLESENAIYMSAASSATLLGKESAYVSGPIVTIGKDDGTSTVNIKGKVYINGELYVPAE